MANQSNDLILFDHETNILCNQYIWFSWIWKIDIFEFDLTDNILVCNFFTWVDTNCYINSHHFNNFIASSIDLVNVWDDKTDNDEVKNQEDHVKQKGCDGTNSDLTSINQDSTIIDNGSIDWLHYKWPKKGHIGVDQSHSSS